MDSGDGYGAWDGLEWLLADQDEAFMGRLTVVIRDDLMGDPDEGDHADSAWDGVNDAGAATANGCMGIFFVGI